jgi:hypothetical protein
MSLSDELSEIVEGGNANKQNKGCYTCKWLARLSAEDLKSFNDWIESKRSLAQLWQVCTEQPDPLDVSLSGLRWHMVHHAKWL